MTRRTNAALASLGVAASVFLCAVLVVQRAGLLGGAANWFSTATWLLWLPVLVFELALSAWLLAGVAARAPVHAV